ncbi:UspA domain protein [Gloeothece citriformis PCC 7424]|uniref:UspA domain protein n=1 Tax=Gloeothece citriformis (strain PCC 7424) TaxID=65393 RepID=B7KIQ9_GLOC7|nr:universal stress protein [Gloeothece citriformis]ACK69465.1 UspA domain protein [Gloeothece citriformis PCC 7424]
MFQRCLICTDFTDGLYRLVNFVPELAKGGLKKIIFLHSLPVWEQERIAGIDEQQIAQARERLCAALEQVPEGVEVKIETPSGRPTETIVRVINSEQIDVVVAGMPIRSLLEEKVFGSTSMELARQTSVPLMILRPQLVSTYTVEELSLRCQHLWRYLLIPYNGTETADYLIRQIKEYAVHRPANSLQQCHLLWVIEDKGRNETLTTHRLEEARQRLNALKQELEALDLKVNVEVRQGNFLQEIVKVAVDCDITAIAIAKEYSSNILNWTVSNVASEVLHRVWFPLLFFSPKK